MLIIASIIFSEVFKAITTGNPFPTVKTPAWLANLAFHTFFTMVIRLFSGLLINILVSGIMREKGMLHVLHVVYIRHYKESNLIKSSEMSKKLLLAGFEPAHPKIMHLKCTALDHSAKVAK